MAAKTVNNLISHSPDASGRVKVKEHTEEPICRRLSNRLHLPCAPGSIVRMYFCSRLSDCFPLAGPLWPALHL